MSLHSRSLIGALIVALTFAFSTPAFAQSSADDEAAAGLAVTSVTSTYVSIFTIPIGLTVLVVVLLLRSSSEMESYIEENNVALQHDLHMGGGETTAELAKVFNVPAEQHAEFAQVLTENRDELLPLTDVDTLTAERAGTFVRVIYDALMEKPQFAQHLPRINGEV
ncbi:DUF3015 domain-containing protein [Bradymonadaceae bacterium TMQ3]|uniref:DUF3015 domain-containing protein n=1 Tax=Lujinxingia sediminis TaxID=2480984 RepID=A0ABY0CUZ6_9DELT|nr:DUF3015 family protein [Lujinxingia sediminis]RDV37435.1 DUF3015 domain-containing protein [Bradymonadaceae bacterium TMQ3]RVU45870.1 DUF3015 domain-containing protein [Lujinxingia sediminis]TXC74993.1 DUF3015 domain-containing protein [Bradymonadales bacterium TMQ1]